MRLIGPCLAAGLLLADSLPAVASPDAPAATCANRSHVIDRLTTEFDERLLATSRSPSGKRLDIYAAPEAVTWSIVLILPERDLACLVGAGSGQVDLDRAMTGR